MTTAAAVTAAVLAALRADDGLAPFAGRIWDIAPSNPGFPHLVVDEISVRDRSGDDVLLEEVRLTLKIVSRAGGRGELAALADRVETVLIAAALAPDGARVALLRRDLVETRRSRDRLSTEASLRFVALTEPA